jgi:hypothetical protein
MTRRCWLLLAGSWVWAAELPSAESLLERYVEATGGRAAYAARKSEIAHGSVEYAAMGLRGQMTRWAAGDGLYRLRMELPGVGAMEAGVKDGVAWERSDLLGPRIKSGVERAEALREARINATARWRELYTRAETTGEEAVNGEDCYRVVLTPEEGAPETLFLSKRTGLALKMQTVASTQLGEVAAEVFFEDYRNIGGILAPARVSQKVAGQTITITIDRAEVNVPIPREQFDLPADVAALLR